MLNESHRPSAVWCCPTSGDRAAGSGRERGGSSPAIDAYAMSGASVHIADASRDVSTTTPVPVRATPTSAAQIPAARNIPDGASPIAARGPTGCGLPGVLSMCPTPPRDQKDTESKPPASASAPRCP